MNFYAIDEKFMSFMYCSKVRRWIWNRSKVRRWILNPEKATVGIIQNISCALNPNI